MELLLVLLLNFFVLQGWRYFKDPYIYIVWTVLFTTLAFWFPALNYACVHEWRAGYISSGLSFVLFMLNLRGYVVVSTICVCCLNLTSFIMSGKFHIFHTQLKRIKQVFRRNWSIFIGDLLLVRFKFSV